MFIFLNLWIQFFLRDACYVYGREQKYKTIFEKYEIDQIDEILEILLILKIEPHPIEIKLIPTWMIDNLDI